MLPAPQFKLGASRVSFDHRLIQEHFQLQKTPVPTNAQMTVIQRERNGQIEPELVLTSANEKRIIHVTRSAESPTGWAYDVSPDIPKWESFAAFPAGRNGSRNASLFCLVKESEHLDYQRLLEKSPGKPWVRRSDADVRDVLRDAHRVGSYAVHYDGAGNVFLTGLAKGSIYSDLHLFYPMPAPSPAVESEVEARPVWGRHVLLKQKPTPDWLCTKIRKRTRHRVVH